MSEFIPSLVPLDQANFEHQRVNYQWRIPEVMNIADLVCSRHADGSGKVALIAESEHQACRQFTFDELDVLSNQLANGLQKLGIKKGDRLAVILPQRVETALLHLAAQKIGAISLPLSVLFGSEALLYRLQDSGSAVVVTNSVKSQQLLPLCQQLPQLKAVLNVDDVNVDDANDASSESAQTNDQLPQDGQLAINSFWQLLSAQNKQFTTPLSSPDEPAFLLYTSGTTGPPKGALIPQRALFGNLTGFECSQNGFPQANDCMYTPADWAWTGGLLDALMPAWFYGVPVVGYESGKFEAEKIAALMHKHKVTCAFIPPTALKMLRASDALFERHPSYLRSMMSAGEALGDALLAWGQTTFGFLINEMCGQTEHNYVMGNCSAVMPVKPGSMGKAYPGHRVAIMDEEGELISNGEQGEIVVHRNDPVHFLGYWNNPAATQSKYRGDWFCTGDVGYCDDDGYLWFLGRADDVISSAGYRIGPGEIEDCVIKHPAVLQVAAIGVPDPDLIRGDIVKLCVVLKPGYKPDDTLAEQIRTRVRDSLAAYEYPRQIEFYEELPMTTTGKVKRRELREQHLAK